MANSIGFGREWDYMVLKLPNNELPFEKRFENIRNCRVLKLAIALQRQRNCRALKHLLADRYGSKGFGRR